MSRALIKAGLGLVLCVLAACGQAPSTDVDFYLKNPTEIDKTLGVCRSGKAPAEACQAASQAQREAASARRMEILKSTRGDARAERETAR